MNTPTALPVCHVNSPICGSCYHETDHDGDSFYCEPCGLDYGNGEDGTVATYRDDDAKPCGKMYSGLGSLVRAYASCPLPKGHLSEHWYTPTT